MPSSIRFKLAIDGPSGVGKSTTANYIADKLGFMRIDSGMIYRALTYILLEEYPDLNDNIIIALESKITKIVLFVTPEEIIFEGNNIKPYVKNSRIDKCVPKVAKHGFVRNWVKGIQHTIVDQVDKRGIVIDGRDIGTVVLPDADLKIFLTASKEARAKRRYEELGGKADYIDVLEDMIKRDYEDLNRIHGPLKQADDAIVVDSTDITFEAQCKIVLALVEKRFSEVLGIKS